MQGWRNTQEDSHIVEITQLGSDIQLYGVFDGHGGSQVALWVQDNFVKIMQDLPSFKSGDYGRALEETYLKIDELVLTPEINK